MKMNAEQNSGRTEWFEGHSLTSLSLSWVFADIALSGPSQTLAAEFAKAAEKLRSASVDVRLGKVDVTDQKDFKKEFNIQDFPTLKFFVDGDRSNPVDCKGQQLVS